MKNILIIAPHPDDETLGAGGTLFSHQKTGDAVYWLIMTKAFPEQGYEKEWIMTRQREIEHITELYCFRDVIRFDHKTTALDQYPLSFLINNISSAIETIQPQTIYLPHAWDVHTDHQITFQAAFSCVKQFRFPFIERVLSYETLSETDFGPALPSTTFIPNVFIDITQTFLQKSKALSVYQSEIKDHPFPRSLKGIEALATVRGAAANVKYAEAFMLLKEVIRS